MRADRLLQILAMLQSRGRLTTREIAETLEISDRTVHRDMEALAQAGIPVYAERGSKGGWTLSEGYRNRITGMTSAEIRSLLLLHSSSVVKDLGLNEQANAAFGKLLSALPAAVRQDAEYVRERIHVDGAGWHADRRAGPSSVAAQASLLRIVQEAVWEQRKLRLRYRGWEADAETERVALPLGLVAKTSVWYLVAAVDKPAEPFAEEEDVRTYRLSRLQDVHALEETFARPEGFELAAYWERSTERFKSRLPRYPARVRISRAKWEAFSKERYVVLLSGSAAGAEETIEAEAEFQTLESAVEILLKYGRHAEALEPDALRAAVLEECRATASLYGFRRT